MGKMYRCSCGTSYNLEEGKKYKCKKCGAAMALPAQMTVPSTAPVAATPRTQSSGSASPATVRRETAPPAQTNPKTPIRPGARPTTRTARTSAARQNTIPKQGMSSGAKIGIGAFITVVVIGIVAMMNSGPSQEEIAKAEQAVKEKAVAAENAKKAAAAAAAAAAKPPAPPKSLTKEEVDATMVTVKKAEEAKDSKSIHDLLAKMKEENWQFDRTPVYYSLLRINPQDPVVTSALGVFQRSKLNYDIYISEPVKRAKAEKNTKILHDAVAFIFANELWHQDNRGIDYILIYKAILEINPDDPEARVCYGKDPYNGPIQEYRGKKLRKDEFMAVKELEMKLK